MKKTTVFVIAVVLLAVIVCWAVKKATAPIIAETVTVHYYDSIVRKYSTAEHESSGIVIEMLAPKGQRIVGICDAEGKKYNVTDKPDYISLKDGCPNDLYAQYGTAITEDVSPMELEEEPEEVQYWSSYRVSDLLCSGNRLSLYESLLSNPYATVSVTLTFMVKGDGSKHSNKLVAYTKVKDTTIASFSEIVNNKEWAQITITGEVQAKEILQNNGWVSSTIGSSLGYDDYLIKNVRYFYAIQYD